VAKKKDEIHVKWGSVNIGEETARVGVTISRANITVGEVDKKLCGKRLSGTIVARANGAQAGQASLPGADDDVKMKGTWDVKGFSASLKNISMGFTFRLASIDVGDLSRFAKREGVAIISGAEDLPEDEQEEENEAE
jgi:hypothetical protein